MSQKGIYSELKPVWWYAREGKLPDAPKQVQLILSGLCNQSCSFCAYRMDGYSSNELFAKGAKLAKFGHNNPVRWMDTKRALDLIEELDSAGVAGIQFTGGGEPTVHPAHEEIFELSLRLGFRCSLVSNGVRWSSDLITSVLPRFDWVRVSIDASNAKAYAALRKSTPDTYEKVWSHVRFLSEAIRVRGTHTALGVGFVVTPHNYEQILDFAAQAKKNNAHNARYTAMFSPEDESPFLGCYDKIMSRLDEAKRLQDSNFTVHDNFGSRIEDLKQHSPDYKTCGYQHYTTYIGDDMQAYRCCVLAYNRRGMIRGGDLSSKRFDEFWESEDRKKDFETFDARGCERCQFNEKNRGINYIMLDKPDHVEWT